MVLKITNDKWENNDIEVIVDSVNALWLNEKNMEEKLGHKNLPVAVAHKFPRRGELSTKRKKVLAHKIKNRYCSRLDQIIILI